MKAACLRVSALQSRTQQAAFGLRRRANTSARPSRSALVRLVRWSGTLQPVESPLDRVRQDGAVRGDDKDVTSAREPILLDERLGIDPHYHLKVLSAVVPVFLTSTARS